MLSARRRQVLSTPDRPLSLFISRSLTMGVPWRNSLSGKWGRSRDGALDGVRVPYWFQRRIFENPLVSHLLIADGRRFQQESQLKQGLADRTTR